MEDWGFHSDFSGKTWDFTRTMMRHENEMVYPCLPNIKTNGKKGQKRGFEMILSHLNITQPTHPEL